MRPVMLCKGTQPRDHGFTLVELAVVLVVIGLLAGGVLAGRSLIAAAEVRSQISQVEELASAVNSFSLKYSYLPGDLPADDADLLGFVPRSGDWGSGDGNGRVEIGALGTGYDGVPGSGGILQGELVFFWTDLSSAGMVDGRFVESGDELVSCPGFNCRAFERWLPYAKMGPGLTFLLAFSNFRVGAIPDYDGLVFEILAVRNLNSGGQLVTLPAMTIGSAFAIDSKMDDGLPLNGVVVSSMPAQVGRTGYGGMNSESGWWTNHGNDARFCVAEAIPLAYNLQFTDSVACSLMIGVRR